MKHRIWMLVILGLLVISLSFSFQVISDPPTDEEEEPITFLASVSIDGFIDDSPGPGLIGEWEDAISQNFGLTGEKDNGFPDFGVRYKVVSDKILVGMTFPRNSISINFEKIVVTFDMNGDKKLTNGDARINIENGGINEGVYYVEAFDNDGFANIEEIGPGLKLNGQIPQTISIAQVAMKTTEQQFTIEMGLSRALFGKLVGLVTNDYIQGVLGQVGFSIILIDGEGTPYGYPGIPVIVSDTNLGKEYYAVGTYHNFVFDLQVPDNYAVNVGITDIEVTQAVSSPSDNIIFVANKPTLARVYFDNPTPFPLQAEVTLSIIDSTFLGSIFGYNISGSMTQTITIPTTTNRENLDHSANFLFPMSWTIQDGVLPRLLRAEINPINFIDTDPSNNDLVDSVWFQNFQSLNIYYIQVNEGTSSSPVLINDINPTFIPQAFDDFQAMYPTATPNFIELDWETLGVFDGTDDELISALNDIVGDLALTILFQTITGVPTEDMIPLPDQIFGFRTSGGGGSSPLWEGHASNFAAWGGLDAVRGPMVFAHELNHNLLRMDSSKHVPGCSAPDTDSSWPTPSDPSIGAYWPDSLGWNSNTGELVSSSTSDFMSYCMGTVYPKSWISDYRWKELYNQLVWGVPRSSGTVTIRPTLNSFALNLNQNTETTRIVSGIVMQIGSATLNPSYTVEGEFRAVMSNPSNAAITHYLEIQYANNSIESLPIAPVYGSSGESLPLSSQNYPYSFWIPDNGEIVSLKLLDINNNTVSSLEGTGFSVIGTLTPPIQFLRGLDLQFKLDTTTLNTSVIFTRLQYSTDGKVWINIGPQTTGILPIIQINKLPGSLEASFRVRYTDGFDTFYLSMTNTLTLSNLPPSVKISHNRHNTSLTSEDRLVLTKFSSLGLNAHGYDPEDGEIKNNSSYTWKILDVNDLVIHTGTGKQFSYNFLTIGTFDVEVTVTDGDGQSSSDRITVESISRSYITQDQYDKFVIELTNFRSSLIPVSQSTETSSSTQVQSTSSSSKKSDGAALDTINIIFILPVLFVVSKIRSRKKIANQL